MEDVGSALQKTWPSALAEQFNHNFYIPQVPSPNSGNGRRRGRITKTKISENSTKVTFIQTFSQSSSRVAYYLSSSVSFTLLIKLN
uniref:Uncharacterized protein n=1 Tax=Strongyloides papillosus TaxID=174720 RepID=A0A0N5C6F3_STREA